MAPGVAVAQADATVAKPVSESYPGEHLPWVSGQCVRCADTANSVCGRVCAPCLQIYRCSIGTAKSWLATIKRKSVDGAGMTPPYRIPVTQASLDAAGIKTELRDGVVYYSVGGAEFVLPDAAFAYSRIDASDTEGRRVAWLTAATPNAPQLRVGGWAEVAFLGTTAPCKVMRFASHVAYVEMGTNHPWPFGSEQCFALEELRPLSDAEAAAHVAKLAEIEKRKSMKSDPTATIRHDDEVMAMMACVPPAAPVAETCHRCGSEDIGGHGDNFENAICFACMQDDDEAAQAAEKENEMPTINEIAEAAEAVPVSLRREDYPSDAAWATALSAVARRVNPSKFSKATAWLGRASIKTARVLDLAFTRFVIALVGAAAVKALRSGWF